MVWSGLASQTGILLRSSEFWFFLKCNDSGRESLSWKVSKRSSPPILLFYTWRHWDAANAPYSLEGTLTSHFIILLLLVALHLMSISSVKLWNYKHIEGQGHCQSGSLHPRAHPRTSSSVEGKSEVVHPSASGKPELECMPLHLNPMLISK